MRNIAISGSLGHFAIGVALASSAAPALAQGSLDDLLGTYPLRVTTKGPGCMLHPNIPLEVKSISGNRISMAATGEDGGILEGPFDPQARTFTATSPGKDGVWTGGFRRLASSVEIVLNLDVKTNVYACQAQLSGSKAAPLVTQEAQEALGSTPNSEGTKTDVNESGDTSEVEMLALLLTFVLMLAAGLALGLRKMRGPSLPVVDEDPGPGGWNPRRPFIRWAVGSDRFGGFEGEESYGDGAGSSTPASAKAYEALVVAQPASSGAASTGPDTGEEGARDAREGQDRTGEEPVGPEPEGR